MPSQLEEALRELAALGLVSSDTFAAVRAIDGGERAQTAGPAAALRQDEGPPARLAHRPLVAVSRHASSRPIAQSQLEHWCKLLLARYGVVFRDLLAREPAAPPWWELVRVLRRMELRGEVRGGRFIARVGGEQFALESAVGRLRDLRDGEPSNEWALISAADPLNLSGIIDDGPRIPAMHKNALVDSERPLRRRQNRRPDRVPRRDRSRPAAPHPQEPASRPQAPPRRGLPGSRAARLSPLRPTARARPHAAPQPAAVWDFVGWAGHRWARPPYFPQ